MNRATRSLCSVALIVLVAAALFQAVRGAEPAPTALGAISISAETDAKPQAKVWFHQSTWWAVLPTNAASPGSGTWVWRLEANNSWAAVLNISDSSDTHADVKCVGDVAHILLYRPSGAAPELVSVRYDSANHTYQRWSARPTTTLLPGFSTSETGTIDIDSMGRMWFVTTPGSVNVYYSDSPYSTFSGPVTLISGIPTDDIAVVTALPNGTIGVLWSNENSNVQRFGFRIHVDGTDPATWLADEVPASQSAASVGLGMADDHMNVKVASDGTLYAGVKTSYDTPGYPKMALLVRRPHTADKGGTWDNLYPVDEAGTRPIVLLDELAGKVRMVYTSSEGYNDIVWKESPMAAIDFSGPRQTLMTGGINNATSSKQNWSGRVVVMASSATQARGVLITREDPSLVGHWRMDETGGIMAFDASGYAAHGTLQGNATRGSGVTGQALVLHGTGDYVNVPNARHLNISNVITVAAWVNPGQYATQDLVKKAVNGTVDGFELSLATTKTDATSQRAFFRLNQAANGDSYRASALTEYPIDGTWMHLAATYDGTNVRLYVNGVLESTVAGPTSLAVNDQDLAIGAQPDGTRGLLGALDDVRIYNRALNGDEIQTLATAVPAAADLSVSDTGIAPNQPPVVEAGVDQTITVPASANLSGTATDDGLPAPPTLTTTWSKVTGLGTVTFGDANALTTTAAFSSAGTYVLRLTANDGELGSSDEVTITVSQDLVTGLVGYWRMEEGGGTSLVDSSGAGNNAAITGSPTWTAAKVGLGLNLNGSNQYAIASTSPSLEITGAITLAAWARPVTTAPQNLLKKGTGTTAATLGYELSLWSSGKALVRLNIGGAIARIDSKTAYPTNSTWIHVAATYEQGGAIRLYINGAEDAEGTPASAFLLPTSTALGIGSEPTTFLNKFTGALDEARIYNRALTPAEIKALVNVPPSVEAGSNQTITLPTAATLIGSVSDDGLPNPPAQVIARWTKTSGPGTVIFANPASPATAATFSATGEYVLRLTGDDGMITAFDEVTVTVNPVVPVDQPPAVPALVGPADGAASVAKPPTLSVEVTDADSSTLNVKFYGRAAGPGPDFSVVVLPDTQNYTAWRPAIFTSQTNWIVANALSRNIAYVAHEGDITNDNTTTQWDNANTSLSVLEPAFTGFPNGIAYGLSVGNHDGSPGNTTLFNQYFGSSRFAGRPYYGAHYGTDNDNHYDLFSAGGLDFIVVHLEYPPAVGVLDWADALLKIHSTRRAIIVTHELLDLGDPAPFTSTGRAIYDALKDNPNIALMLCGHNHGEGRRSDTYGGNTIHTLLADYQALADGGGGWLRLLEFSPASNEIRVKTYSPWLDQSNTDATSQFTLPYSMTSTAPFELVGQVTVASGGTASLTWSGLADGSEYEWYATVSDTATTVTGPTWSLTTAAPVPVLRDLSVARTGTGSGSVTSLPAGIDCGSSCSASYDHGTVVWLTATPAIGSMFTGWSGACTGTGSCLVTMDDVKAVTATFARATYTLTVAKTGTGSGSVTSLSAGIDCGAACSANYDYNTVVTLTAAPAVGSTFRGWSGACTGTADCVVTMDQTKAVTAAFALNVTYYVDNTNPSCSDAGAGTSAGVPFCTLTRGAAVAVAGDTVRVLAGTYAEVVKPNPGTAGSPVTFSAAPGVTVTGPAGNSSNGGAFRITSKSYIVVDGFTISGTADYGIILDTSNHITISNNHVSYSGTAANHRVGIYLRATTDSLITGNTTDHNTMDGIRLTAGGCPAACVGSDRNTVSNNRSFGNAEGTGRNATGINVLTSNYNTIIHNITYANEDTGLNFYTGSSYNLVVGNLTYGNGDHGIDNNASPNNVIIGNTVHGNVTVGINLEGASSPGSGGATVINNVSTDNGLRRQTDGSTSTGSWGNIRVDSQSLVGTTLDYNQLYLSTGTVQIDWNNSGYPSLAAFQAAVPGQETHGLQADPRFAAPAPIAERPYQAPYNVAINVGDYRLTAGSPAIDSANSDAPNEPASDIEGKARFDDLATIDTGAGVRAYDDRGAYEFVGYTLTLTTVGTGTGAVTSLPAGIDCGLDCSESYTHGTVVTLTAVPTFQSTFTGWGGACTGTGSCVVTMDAVKTVTAAFTAYVDQPPTVTVPAPITGVQATGAGGAAVTFTVTASDVEDGVLTPTCLPVSGATFPLGTTTVSCSVTDSAGHTVSGSFDVTVVDTTGPVFSGVAANIGVAATSAAGAVVTFPAPTATDLVSGSREVTCVPASGSTFPAGVTTVTCRATDAASNAGSASFTVTVAAYVDQAPTVTVPAPITGVQATGAGGAVVTFTVTASDVEDGVLTPTCLPVSGATFPLGTTTVSCSVTDSAGHTVSGSFDVTVVDTTGPVFSGVAANIGVAATSAAGAVVTFPAPTATDLVSGSREVTCVPASGSTFPAGVTTVTCSATDAASNAGSASFTVTVAAYVNQAPTVTGPGNQASAEGAIISLAVTASDPEGDTVAYSATGLPGGLSINPTTGVISGTISYASAGTYPATVMVTDPGNASGSASFTWTVSNVNRAPTANPQTVTTAEDAARAIALTGSDPDSDSLTYAVVTSPAHGTLSGAAPNLTYTPAANYAGPDSFTFKARDATTDSTPATVTITVTQVNDAPSVTNPSAKASAEGAIISLAVTASDPEGDTVAYSAAGLPGGLSINPATGVISGTISYASAGTYPATVTVTDPGNASGSASFTWTVSNVNRAPSVTNPGTQASGVGATVNVQIVASDADGDALTYSATGLPTGLAIGSTNGRITGTIASKAAPGNNVVVTVTDGTTPAQVAFAWTVSNANHPPLANDQAVTTMEDTNKAITLTGTDPEGRRITYTVVRWPEHGTLTGRLPNLTYRPAQNFNGTDSFTFRVSDGVLTSAPATVQIMVTPVNDAPVASGGNIKAQLNVPFSGTLQAKDVDSAALTFSVVSGPASGNSVVLTDPATGTYRYVATRKHLGIDAFTFRVWDGTAYSNTAQIRIVIK